MEDGEQPIGISGEQTSEDPHTKPSPLLQYKSPGSVEDAGPPILEASAPGALPLPSKWSPGGPQSRDDTMPSFNPLTAARTEPGGAVPPLPQGDLDLPPFGSHEEHGGHFGGTDSAEEPGSSALIGPHVFDALMQRVARRTGSEGTGLGWGAASEAAAWAGSERGLAPGSRAGARGARDSLDGEGIFLDDNAGESLECLPETSGGAHRKQDTEAVVTDAIDDFGDEAEEVQESWDDLEDTSGGLRDGLEDTSGRLGQGLGQGLEGFESGIPVSNDEDRHVGASAAGFVDTSSEIENEEVEPGEEGDAEGGDVRGFGVPGDGVLGIPGPRDVPQGAGLQGGPLQQDPPTAGMEEPGPEDARDKIYARGRLPAGFLNESNQALEAEVAALEEELRAVKASREDLQERKKIMADHLANVKTEVQYKHSQMVAREKEIDTQRSFCKLKTLEKVRSVEPVKT